MDYSSLLKNVRPNRKPLYVALLAGEDKVLLSREWGETIVEEATNKIRVYTNTPRQRSPEVGKVEVADSVRELPVKPKRKYNKKKNNGKI